MRLSTRTFLLVMAAIAAVLVWTGVQRGVLLLPGMGPHVQGARVQGQQYGAIFVEPGRYQGTVLKDAWVRRIDLGSGTFGSTLPSQPRFSIEGSGSISSRKVVANTPAAAKLLDGGGRLQRTTRFLHGLQQLMDERKGYVSGFSLSNSDPGFTANWLVVFAESGLFSQVQTPRDQRLLTRALMQYAKQWMPDTLAWYQFNSHWIVLGPQQSLMLEQYLSTPRTMTPMKGLRVAYILRHELEHSVSAHDSAYDMTLAQYRHIMWLEEGTADTLARWPGQAAHTAAALGLPYPRRADALAYDQLDAKASGYTQWVTAMRGILTLAGVRTGSVADFRLADQLLQGGKVEQTPERLAAAIARQQHLRTSAQPIIAAAIRAADGKPSRVGALARTVKHMPRAAA